MHPMQGQLDFEARDEHVQSVEQTPWLVPKTGLD